MTNSSVKDVNHLTAYIEDLFIVVKVCIRPATHFGWATDRRMVHQSGRDFLNNAFQVLNLVFLPSPWPAAFPRPESSDCPTVYSKLGGQ